MLFLALIFFVPSLAYSNIVTFKLGYFVPSFKYDNKADNLWWIEFDQMSFSKSDYHSTNFGFAFEYFLTREISLTLSIDSYSRNKLGQYKNDDTEFGYVGYYADTLGTDYDFAFPNVYYGDFIPMHTFNISITPLQISLKLAPLGRKGKIIPYVGGGAGFYLWSLRLQGDLIDFDTSLGQWYYNELTGEIHLNNYNPDEDIEIFPTYFADARDDNKFSIGYHAFGGIMIPVARRTTLELEFKYNSIRVNLDNFQGFERFDLGGYQASVGLNYWF